MEVMLLPLSLYFCVSDLRPLINVIASIYTMYIKTRKKKLRNYEFSMHIKLLYLYFIGRVVI